MKSLYMLIHFVGSLTTTFVCDAALLSCSMAATGRRMVLCRWIGNTSKRSIAIALDRGRGVDGGYDADADATGMWGKRDRETRLPLSCCPAAFVSCQSM